MFGRVGGSNRCRIPSSSFKGSDFKSDPTDGKGAGFFMGFKGSRFKRDPLHNTATGERPRHSVHEQDQRVVRCGILRAVSKDRISNATPLHGTNRPTQHRLRCRGLRADHASRSPNPPRSVPGDMEANSAEASNKCVFVKIDFLTIPKWPTPATWNICLTNFKTGRKTRLFCPKNGLCFTLSGGLLY